MTHQETPAPVITVVERRSCDDAPHAETLRVVTDDGAETTAHVAAYPLTRTTVRIVRLQPAEAVAEWAAAAGVAEAMSGGFLVKPDFVPLGKLVTHDGPTDHRPFRAPWHLERGCLWISGSLQRIAPRRQIVASARDQLLQAGPILVSDARTLAADADPEGFSTTCGEFDQDFTAERLPRMAIGYSDDAWLAVSVDGRSTEDAGLYLSELAQLLAILGAEAALNLDGGSSSALVAGGHMRNTPRDDEGNVLAAGGPTTTAITFDVEAPNR